ncbi:MAG: PaaI family thioesterase [Ottowia sp.]|uniref:PaaI family thioesterase n=1 Tax=Ottowia sp. TaxID=1898956 RepID=UPI001DEF471F|nr:PaaI family thioesterase [Ottowia sp.]MCP5256695.1 PaaI family thioesterase [Burkholderiaceae bacterium]MCB2023822.1 PaaI family thioesterase [Ottowia sp.]MCB2033426.1 PaaI family thioesterase [Ottowia sp.]MCB2070862.1 PaaI family thioesterase [Ottowia sp.]HPK31777.1 PaaI family thioesterase [Ottowia sp.]
MKLPVPEFTNPDQALIHRFVQGGERPMAFDANPMARALGTELRAADLQAGRVTLAFEPDPLFIQGTGVIQGGALTAMLDFAMAFATLAQMPVGGSCATVNLNTAFLRPAPQGRYLALGEVERRGRQLAFTHARLLREDGEVLVATATSTLALMAPDS